MKIKTICGLVSGLIALGSVAQAEQQDYNKFKHLYFQGSRGAIALQYDTDHDGVADQMYVYRIQGATNNGSMLKGELMCVYEDKNKDNRFTSDEMVYSNPRYNNPQKREIKPDFGNKLDV